MFKNIKNKLKSSSILLIIVATFFGLAGGLVGDLIARSYLLDISYNLPFFGNIDFSKIDYKRPGLIISNARNVIIQQDTKIDEMINSTSNSLVGIFKKQKVNKTSTSFDLNNYYRLDQPMGVGFVITSDGWIIASLQFDKKVDLADFVVITKDRKIYIIDKIISDNLTSFNFLHVAVRDFSVRKFAERGDIRNGSLAVAVNWVGNSWLSSVVGEQESIDNPINSSDSYFKKFFLKDSLPLEFRGSVIFNLAGDIVGLSDNQGKVELITHLEGAIKSLLKYKEVLRPSLGINYLNLSRLVVASNLEQVKMEKGALIYKDAKGVAVVKGGAAYLAGLKQGDIIVSIDNIELDKNNNLTDIIQSYTAGERVKISYWRGDELKEVEVLLGEMK